MAERTIKLGSDELQVVWGEVYIPNLPDSDGDFMTPESIREMAWRFMKNAADGRLTQIDVRHNNKVVKGCCVVESYIARANDPDGFIKDAWVAGVHIPDTETWGAIKKGELNGFSMEALVTKTPIELELDIPPVLTGKTMKADNHGDDHTHEYHVAYAEDGTFQGGRTNIVNGHWHAIKRGTITESAAGHHHKFAMPDVLTNAVSKADLSVASLDNTQGGAGSKNSEIDPEEYSHHVAGHSHPGKFGSPIRADIFSLARASKADIAQPDLDKAGKKNPDQSAYPSAVDRRPPKKKKFVRQRIA